MPLKSPFPRILERFYGKLLYGGSPQRFGPPCFGGQPLTQARTPPKTQDWLGVQHGTCPDIGR